MRRQPLRTNPEGVAVTRSPTDERNRAITQAQLDYDAARRSNGNASDPDKAVPHPHPLYCSAPDCGGVAAPEVLTPDAARRPVSLAVLVALLVAAASLVGGWLTIDGHLREARAAALQQHSTSSTAHPDIRKAQERAAKRIEGRLDAVTHALDRIREDLRQRAAEPARRRRR